MGKMHIMLACPKGCRGCLFLSHNCCDFIGMTGTARMKICKPGVDCTVKATTKKRKEEIMAIYGKTRQGKEQEAHKRGGRNRAVNCERKHTGRHRKFDQMEAWKMYENERMSDRAIAERLGVKENTIAKWRWRNGYPPNRSNAHTLLEREPTLPPTEGT